MKPRKPRKPRDFKPLDGGTIRAIREHIFITIEGSFQSMFIGDAKEARKLAAWLLRASKWIDRHNEKGK